MCSNARLLPVTLAVAASCASAGAPDGGGTVASVDGCPAKRLPGARSALPQRFFPSAGRALWAPAAPRGCVYVLPSRRATARAVWRARAGERIRGLGWAPDRRTFVVATTSATGGRVYIFGGRKRERLAVDGLAFFADGDGIVARKSALFLRHAGRERRLVVAAQLAAAAGFPAHAPPWVGDDRHGFARGYGRSTLALSWFGATKQAILTVSSSGQVRRLGPAFVLASDRNGSPGGRAWSPNGRFLAQVVGELPGRAELELGHDHCINRWDGHRYRRLVCGSALRGANRRHFDRLVWSTDGRQLLVNSGTVLTASGRYVKQIAVAQFAFELHWSTTDTR